MTIYMEIRGCAGGDEAEIFADEIMYVYLKFAKKHNININLLNTGKTRIISFSGKEKFIKILFNESGIHRVQRISKTESKEKMHTSTISVAAYCLPENKKYIINEKDLVIERFRASGNGGQHRNTTDSAIRITHKPTGITAICVSERSQYQNKVTAMELLYAKIGKLNTNISKNKLNNEKSLQLKDGQRAQSRRTYNYQRKEVLDNNTNRRCLLKDFLKGNLELIC